MFKSTVSAAKETHSQGLYPYIYIYRIPSYKDRKSNIDRYRRTPPPNHGWISQIKDKEHPGLTPKQPAKYINQYIIKIFPGTCPFEHVQPHPPRFTLQLTTEALQLAWSLRRFFRRALHFTRTWSLFSTFDKLQRSLKPLKPRSYLFEVLLTQIGETFAPLHQMTGKLPLDLQLWQNFHVPPNPNF